MTVCIFLLVASTSNCEPALARFFRQPREVMRARYRLAVTRIARCEHNACLGICCDKVRDRAFTQTVVELCDIRGFEQRSHAVTKSCFAAIDDPPVSASQGFRSFWGAWRTIAGYEAIHMIRKSQACWSAAGAKISLLHRFILELFATTN
jgi:hypothetical protein